MPDTILATVLAVAGAMIKRSNLFIMNRPVLGLLAPSSRSRKTSSMYPPPEISVSRSKRPYILATSSPARETKVQTLLFRDISLMAAKLSAR